jgi:hypothetical protein
MLVVKTSVGDESVLIEAVEEQIEVVGAWGQRQTEPTSIEDTLGEAYQRVKYLISTIATDFATDLKTVLATGQKIELEFSLGLSASSGLWGDKRKGRGIH